MKWLLIGGLVVLVALGGFGVVSRVRDRHALTTDATAAAVPVVAVTRPQPARGEQATVLPGTVQPWQSAPILARTTGFVRSWSVDLGSRVKKGQRLAELDTPDVDNQLAQGRSQLVSDQANAEFARVTSNRYVQLVKDNLVAKQQGDEFAAQAAASAATVEADRANVRRLEDLQRFKFIEAPFDGVITQRNAQVGALIDSGATGAALFQIADTSKLRVFIDVPEASAHDVAAGVRAKIVLARSGGRPLEGSVTRTADALDPATRTLRAEIDLPNPDGLMPGLYAQVTLAIPGPTNHFTVPANTLLFRAEGPRLGLVDREGKVHLQPISLGRDFGQRLEVTSGLEADSQVVVNPSDSLSEGQLVKLKPADAPDAGASGKPSPAS